MTRTPEPSSPALPAPTLIFFFDKSKRKPYLYLTSLTSSGERECMPKMPKKFSRGSILAPAGGLKATGNSWQLQTAKARLSEVFRLARAAGPQRITRQGKEGVIVISDEQFEELVGRSHQPKNLVQFFRESPLVGVELDLERNTDTGRDIKL